MIPDLTDVYNKNRIVTTAIVIVVPIVVIVVVVRTVFSGGDVILDDRTAARVADAPQQVAASIEAERQVIAKAALSLARDKAAAVLTMLDRASGASAAWQNEVHPLLTNERGKMLAANPDYVRAFDSINRQSRPTPTEIAASPDESSRSSRVRHRP